jgi:deazaflavin-dependent oxidoreductase (nitroreductase family)
MTTAGMGLLSELGYAYEPANPLQRGVQAIVSSRVGAAVFSRTLHPMDKVAFRLSNGKATVASILGGVPVIMLTTTGRRSGRLRTMPLLGIPVGEDVAVIGTRFGRQSTPAWVYNLETDPSAQVTYRDRTVEVTARPADQAEFEAAFDMAATVYPGYGRYRDRITSRDIRVFILEVPRVDG